MGVCVYVKAMQKNTLHVPVEGYLFYFEIDGTALIKLDATIHSFIALRLI